MSLHSSGLQHALGAIAVPDEFDSAHLTAEHDIAAFASGRDLLDNWLRADALRAKERGTATTTVWTPARSRRVVAFYAVSPTEGVREDFSSSQAGGLTRIPGYLIGRLAVNQTLQGQGLGADLLHDAIETCVRAAEIGSGRLIVVDAIDQLAERFYLHHGFQPTKVQRRLVLKVAAARASLRI